MEEEKKSEEPVKEEEPKAASLSAEQITERMDLATTKLEEATKRLEAERGELEKARVKAALAGKSEAGVSGEKREETPEEYKDRIMRNE